MKISVLVCLSSLRSTYCHCSHEISSRTTALISAMVLAPFPLWHCRLSMTVIADYINQTVGNNLLDPQNEEESSKVHFMFQIKAVTTVFWLVRFLLLDSNI